MISLSLSCLWIMRLSVVFGTRANDFSLPHLKRIFYCLYEQTFHDFQVFVVCDRMFQNKKEYDLFYDDLKIKLKDTSSILDKVKFITNLNSDFIPQSLGGASYVRNFGIKSVNTELIQLFDDDNAFDPTYLEQAVTYYDQQKRQEQTEVVICSTMYYRDTAIIQNQGFSTFCYWQSRPIVHYLWEKKVSEIQMFSGNWLLWNTEIFASVAYDEQIAWIAEDLDFTLSLHERWVKLFTYADLIVRHYERDKALLEHSWIGFQKQAYQKSRNRFLFVYKHGNFWNKVTFWCLGLPGCLAWLSVKAIIWWGKERWEIVWGLFGGCREGWRLVRKK